VKKDILPTDVSKIGFIQLLIENYGFDKDVFLII